MQEITYPPAFAASPQAAADELASDFEFLSDPQSRSQYLSDLADKLPPLFDELKKALEEQLLAWGELKSKDVPELNQRLKKARLPLIDVQKPVPGATDEAQTTSQDRDENEE